MCQFLETIAILNKKPRNLFWHNQRFNQTRKQFFGIQQRIDLQDFIQIPTEISNELHKCKITYNKNILRIDLTAYKSIKIKKMYLIENPLIQYDYKYKDRGFFNTLHKNQPKDVDFLITKNQKLTDFTYSNIALYNGQEWHTPKTYLLNGTMRQQLIHNNQIKEKIIRIQDLENYTHCKRINAMLGFEESETYSTKIIQTEKAIFMPK